jgi:hypothetical protein
MARQDFVLPSREEDVTRLTEAGISPEQIILSSLSVNTDLFHPLEMDTEQQETYHGDVLLPGKGISLDAEDYGIQLPTHQKLWGAVIDQLKQHPEKYYTETADQFLLRAQQCGVELQEEDMKHFFVNLIQVHLAEGVLRQVYRQHLEHTGVTIGHWDEIYGRITNQNCTTDRQKQSIQEPYAKRDENANFRNLLYNGGRIILHISGDHHPQQYLLEAIAAGALVVVKSHPRYQEPDGLGSMFSLDKEIIPFDTPKDLVWKVRYYLEHEPQRQEIAQRARKTLLDNHSTLERVRQMLSIIAQRLR